MRRRARRRLGLLLLLPLGGALLAGSCSSRQPAPVRPAGGGPPGGTGGSGAAGPSDAGSDRPPCETPDAESWSPGVDSCFRPVDWPAPCDIEVAEQPWLAVPPLGWEPCPWQEGCQRIATPWDHPSAGRIVFRPSVLPMGHGYRLGIGLAWQRYGKFTERAAIYDTGGSPMAAWRSQPDLCSVLSPILAPSRAWLIGMSVEKQGGVHFAYVPAGYDELDTASEALPLDTASQGTHASDDLLAIWGYAGVRLTIYDGQSATAQIFGSPDYPGYQPGFPVGDSVLAMCLGEYNHPKECIWNRSTKTMDHLIWPSTEVVPLAATDGQTLVWAQTPPMVLPADAWPAGTLWTSPFATSAAGLHPTKRCSLPPIVNEEGMVGDGYFAMTRYADQEIDIYRLSDMRRWTFEVPLDTAGWLHDLVYLGEGQLWYLTEYLYRQRLDALGPGEPCPPP